MKQVLASVIVLYNPDDSVVDNIASYLGDVDKLYAVDNSVNKNLTLIEKLKKEPKIKYIDNQGNQGIAHALNVGCKEAIKEGYQWLLTMDQDSKVSETMIRTMLPFTRSEMNNAIVSPFHANAFAPRSLQEEDCSYIPVTMTSGNLLNLALYEKIGPFSQELFIDYVDNEYCLRATTLGYRILQVNKAVLEHKLGDLRQHKLLYKRFYSTNHSAIRRYYMFRNRGVIISRYKSLYPEYARLEFSRYFVDFIIVLLYEKDKLNKFLMMYRGLRDFYQKQFGPYKG